MADPPGLDVTTGIRIGRPRGEVARFAADPDNVPAWYVNIRSVAWQTPRPARCGSRIAFQARFLGRDLAYVYEIVEWVPEETLVMRTADGPFPMETTYHWADEADGATRMTLRNRGSPSGFSRLLAPFMGMAVRRANRKDLARLKAVLETTARP